MTRFSGSLLAGSVGRTVEATVMAPQTRSVATAAPQGTSPAR